MATRLLLADLAEQVGRDHGLDVAFESGGGVEIARRVREGAEADVLVLAHDALRSLEDDGHVVAGTVRPLFVSDVVAAVPASAPLPALAVESDLSEALLAATKVAYSTGPSGTALLDLVKQWYLEDEVGPKLVQAPPGVPVGTFLAEGHADLAFQQRSELTGVPGVAIVGPLPGTAAIRSTFSGGVLTSSAQPELAERVLELLRSDDAASVIRERGMEPA